MAHAIRNSEKALQVLLAGERDDAIQCRHAGEAHSKQCYNNVTAANVGAAAKHNVHQ